MNNIETKYDLANQIINIIDYGERSDRQIINNIRDLSFHMLREKVAKSQLEKELKEINLGIMGRFLRRLGFRQ